MNVRGPIRVDIVVCVLFIVTAFWGISTWFEKHQREAQEEAANKAHAAAETQQAKAAFARLRSTWKADDSWEHKVYPSTNDAPSFSLDVEHALVNGSPIIVIGEVQDVRTSEDQGSPLVLIRSHASKNLVDLRFSLVATPEVANSILSSTRHDSLAEFETVIAVATVQRVEKVEQPPDVHDNDQTYFLAHGTLHEAYATHRLMLDPKELREK